MYRIRAITILLDKQVERLIGGALWIAGAGLTAMALLVFATAMARWIFSKAIVWGFEVTEYIWVGVALLILAYTLRADSHIRIPLVFDRLPRKSKPLIQYLSDIILLGLAVMLLIACVKLVIDSYQLHSISLTVLGMVQWIPQLVLPIGFALLSLAALVKVIQGPQHLN